MKQLDIRKVRQVLHSHIGSEVFVKSNCGRHRYEITRGVITETYPSIFLVKVDDDTKRESHTVSFSYSDIVTKDVRLALCQAGS